MDQSEFELYKLHLNGEILEPHELLSLRFGEIKKLTFQLSRQYFFKGKSDSSNMEKKVPKQKFTEFSLIPKEDMQALKQDLKRSQKLIDKLIQDKKVKF